MANNYKSQNNDKPQPQTNKNPVVLPPQNVEAEASLIGSLLIDKDAIIKVADIVGQDDFYVTKNSQIFESILALFEHREPTDTPQPIVSVPLQGAPDGQDVAGKVIEGHFDGQNMIGPDGKIYPVPANYASKSKLIEGDNLKLTISPDGSFIYKQIGPIERKNLIAKIGLDDGQYSAIVGDNQYKVLYASVTYFKAQPGDEVTIVVPASGEANWAAIEAVIGS